MLKRLWILLLAIALIVGTTASVPRALAMDDCPLAAASMDPFGDGGQSGAPCKRMTPACIDTMGCVAVVAIPAPTSPVLTTFTWVAATYSFSDPLFSGRSVEPELSPPIFPA